MGQGQWILLRCAHHDSHTTLPDVIRSTDVGASQLIIDGKIKLKNDSQISRFTKNRLEFTNGSTLDADAVVVATGYHVIFSSR